MLALKERNCRKIRKGEAPLSNREIAALKVQLLTDWEVSDGKVLKKIFHFESFSRAVAFVQEISIVAVSEDHHPDICILYSKVEVELTTKDLNGLTENDFIMAAKIEEL